MLAAALPLLLSSSALVNVFTGTGGYPHASGMTFPGATTPFGMVRVSPDGSYGDQLVRGLLYRHVNMGTAGYFPGYTRLLGFSHTRLSGAGVREGGALRVTPEDHAFGARSWQDGVPFPEAERREQGEPGYYRVELPAIHAIVEVTATAHAAIHRYTFAPGSTPYLYFDATSALEPTSTPRGGALEADAAAATIRGQGAADGQFSAALGGARVAFAVGLSRTPVNVRSWNGTELRDSPRVAAPEEAGLELAFAPNPHGPTVVEVRVGLSYIDAGGAKSNLDLEVGTASFEEVRARAAALWDRALGKIEVDAEATRSVFYSAFYHALLMPTLATDESGNYIDKNGGVHQATGFTYRADLSLWDIYRTQVPLLALVAPEVHHDLIHSLLAMAGVSGRLPLWPLVQGDAQCMVGSPATIVIAEAFLKGMADFPAKEAVALMHQRDGSPACDALAYCPADEVEQSVSRTIEDSAAADSAAAMALRLGMAGDQEFFLRRAKQYLNLWNPKTRMFQGRLRDGSWADPPPLWLTPFLEALWGGHRTDPYTEGSADQWRWAVPAASTKLVAAFGGAAAFTADLATFLASASSARGALYPGGGYWHGNEHDFHAAYLFDEAGRPDLTQRWVRWILATRYASGPDGLDGNDDGGAMSAWYVFSALGFYPIAGTDQYWIGSPNVARAKVSLPSGRILEIVAHDQADKNIYLARVLLNGKALCAPRLSHAQVTAGGRLEFYMAEAPGAGSGFSCSR